MFRKILLISVLAGLFITPMIASAEWIKMGHNIIKEATYYYGGPMKATINIKDIWYWKPTSTHPKHYWYSIMTINATGGRYQYCRWYSNYGYGNIAREYWGKSTPFYFKGNALGPWFALGAKAYSSYYHKASVSVAFSY